MTLLHRSSSSGTTGAGQHKQRHQVAQQPNCSSSSRREGVQCRAVRVRWEAPPVHGVAGWNAAPGTVVDLLGGAGAALRQDPRQQHEHEQQRQGPPLSGARGQQAHVLAPAQRPLDSKLLTSRIARCSSWQQLRAMLQAHAQQMNSIHVSALVTCLAKVVPSGATGAAPSAAPHQQHSGSLDAFLQQVSALVSRHLDSFDPRALVREARGAGHGFRSAARACGAAQT